LPRSPAIHKRRIVRDDRDFDHIQDPNP
jgi:hypothetical protein